jgi:glucokinase
MLEERGMEARLLNDFEALAHGVAHAAPEDSIVLQEGRAEPRGAIAIVGAGTGLGVAALRWDGARYVPSPSEAGHMTFGARDETEFALAQAMRQAHGGRVSAERVISGPGLARTYGFLARGDASTTGTAHEDPARISARALDDPGSTEARALDLFVRAYGAFAGDVALAFLARGGVWIVGSIAARLRARLSRADFLAAFNDKGRHRPLAEAMPVRLAVNENLGLLGAAWAACAYG